MNIFIVQEATTGYDNYDVIGVVDSHQDAEQLIKVFKMDEMHKDNEFVIECWQLNSGRLG